MDDEGMRKGCSARINHAIELMVTTLYQLSLSLSSFDFLIISVKRCLEREQKIMMVTKLTGVHDEVMLKRLQKVRDFEKKFGTSIHSASALLEL